MRTFMVVISKFVEITLNYINKDGLNTVKIPNLTITREFLFNVQT